MLRYLPERATSIRVQSRPVHGYHSVLIHSTLVGQQHRSRVRDLDASLRKFR